jgi:hypothetical protein
MIRLIHQDKGEGFGWEDRDGRAGNVDEPQEMAFSRAGTPQPFYPDLF